MSRNTRRSLLYAPANRSHKIERAARSDADAVILDLESTVDESAKDDARATLAPALSDLDFGEKETVVRINGLRTSRWLADLEAAIDAGTDTIRLPKIEDAGEVETAVRVARQLADPVPEFLLQLETPQGVLNGRDIAVACADLPEVTGIGVGMGDYRKSLDVDHHVPDMRSFLLNRTAALAAVGGMDALGYVHKERDDLRDVATRARNLGHVGQPVSHTVDPDEFVPVINDVYAD